MGQGEEVRDALYFFYVGVGMVRGSGGRLQNSGRWKEDGPVWQPRTRGACAKPAHFSLEGRCPARVWRHGQWVALAAGRAASRSCSWQRIPAVQCPKMQMAAALYDSAEGLVLWTLQQ